MTDTFKDREKKAQSRAEALGLKLCKSRKKPSALFIKQTGPYSLELLPLRTSLERWEQTPLTNYQDLLLEDVEEALDKLEGIANPMPHPH